MMVGIVVDLMSHVILNCFIFRLSSVKNFPLIFIGCYYPNYHGDGYCDDENNNEACFFDGGDCCGSNVNNKYCIACVCHNIS